MSETDPYNNHFKNKNKNKNKILKNIIKLHVLYYMHFYLHVRGLSTLVVCICMERGEYVCNVAMATFIPGFDPMGWGHRSGCGMRSQVLRGVGGRMQLLNIITCLPKPLWHLSKQLSLIYHTTPMFGINISLPTPTPPSSFWNTGNSCCCVQREKQL